MGMFDVFETNNKFKCKSCNKKFTITDGVQSKAFECLLDHFNIGDVVDDINRSTIFINEYEWCPHCEEKVDLYISFYKKI